MNGGRKKLTCQMNSNSNSNRQTDEHDLELIIEMLDGSKRRLSDASPCVPSSLTG